MSDDAKLAEIEARHAEDEADPFRSSAYVAHLHRGTLLRMLDEAAAERKTLMARWAIETDESLTECVERNIDGWKQRALKAEAREARLREAIEDYLQSASDLQQANQSNAPAAYRLAAIAFDKASAALSAALADGVKR